MAFGTGVAPCRQVIQRYSRGQVRAAVVSVEAKLVSLGEFMKFEGSLVRGIRMWVLAAMIVGGIGVSTVSTADEAARSCSAAEGSIKVAAFMKRLPNVTHEQFKEHYERVHSRIGEKYLKKHAIKYTRKYLTPFPDPVTGNEQPRSFDTITEIWYPNKAAYDAANAQFSDPAVFKEIMDDVQTFLDLKNSPHFIVDMCESKLDE